NEVWLDSGSAYSVPQSFSLGSGQRLTTNGTVTGSVSADLMVELVYDHQFYIGITQNISSVGLVRLRVEAADGCRGRFRMAVRRLERRGGRLCVKLQRLFFPDSGPRS